MTQYLGLARADTDVWAPGWLWVMSEWVWIPGTYASIAVLPWLVSPRKVPPWVHGVVVLGLVAVSWRVLAELTASYVAISNPLAVMPDWYSDLTDSLGVWPDRLCVLLSVAGVARLAWFRSVAGEQGRGYGWLAMGQLFFAIAYMPVVFPAPAGLEEVATDFSGASLIAAQAFLPGALLVVVLGQKLWGIEVVVDRAVVWLALSAALVTSYLLAAWFVQQRLATSADVAAMAALAVLLVASQPLRTWIQQRADRLVYGAVDDPAALIGSLGTVAASSADRGGIDAVAVALATSLRLGSAEIRDADGETIATAGTVASPTSDAYHIPLTVDSRAMGSLIVTASPGQSLDSRSRRLIAQVSGLIGISLELATVNARLNGATARLVEVRQEERRMLRRDLHDGMGPALAGLGLGIAAVEKRLDHDLDGARDLLAELRAEVSRRSQDVRLLSRSLLPAALDNGDLGGALEALAARFEASGLRIVVDYGQLGELDTHRQIAIYHVAAEALLNAQRHGGAREVTIKVEGGGVGDTLLEVIDDGCGIDPASKHGVGLRSMRERADELRGTFEISRGGAGHGTHVRMVIP
ncbi:sensor histidine kinase [Nocardioides hankookensis]|uniref:Sensor histidine kinase n=1 Tax=Nocardioides hankookensis TaxID=443157 RepID=A0ABW1LM54_9ACTN